MAAIGARHGVCSLESFNFSGCPHAEIPVRGFVAGDLSGLFLSGPVGTGKTHLLVAILRAMYRPGDYWPIIEMMAAYRREVREEGYYISRQLREADVLCIDDMGSERSTDFALESVEGLIDYRYRMMSPTAVATNLTVDKFVERYGNRIVSRLSERGALVILGGSDHRLQEAKP
jgi:DNA replication protein DnaC